MASSTLQQVVDSQLQELDLQAVERSLAGLESEVRRQLPSLDLRQLIFHGEGLDLGSLAASLWRYLLRELVFNFRLLGQLIILAILAALLQSLQKTFTEQDTVDVSLLCCLIVLLHIALQSFKIALATGSGAIETMTSMMYAVLPLLSTTLAAVGAVTSAALLHPLLMAVVGLVATAVKQIVFPLLLVGTVLGVAGNLFREFPIRRLADLVQKAGILFLGALFTVFIAIITVRGVLAPVTDGVTIRTARFLAGKAIPVIGSMFAQALDVVVGGSLLIKNALGMFGLAAIVVIVAFPLVKIAVLVLIYRFVTALVEPISDERLVAALSSCSSVLMLLFAAVTTVAVMFFLTITIMVGMGNVTAMLR